MFIGILVFLAGRACGTRPVAGHYPYYVRPGARAKRYVDSSASCIQVLPHPVSRSVARVREVGATLEERLANAAAMDPTEDARLTLITCWPEWAYTHRVVVVARPE